MKEIRSATANEAAEITSLAFRAKAFWGYPEEMMAVFREELRVTGDQLLVHCAHVFEREDVIAGCYMLVAHSAELVELNHLFVDPAYLRRGIGSALFQHAVELTRARGFRRMKVISDPHARGFYESLGALEVGSHQSEFPGRTLPILELQI